MSGCRSSPSGRWWRERAHQAWSWFRDEPLGGKLAVVVYVLMIVLATWALLMGGGDAP